MAAWNENLLKQKWLHSFEEDTADERVYRPEGFTFKPARGRAQFELKENGELMETPIGNEDRPQPVKGSWKLEGDHLLMATVDGADHQYSLKEVKPDKLVFKK